MRRCYLAACSSLTTTASGRSISGSSSGPQWEGGQYRTQSRGYPPGAIANSSQPAVLRQGQRPQAACLPLNLQN